VWIRNQTHAITGDFSEIAGNFTDNGMKEQKSAF
jgi:hypothetical protein